MNSTNNLTCELSQFIGTEKYYRFTNRHLLTDGTKFLMEKAECHWLMVAIASYLTRLYDDYFAVALLHIRNNKAVLTIDDGNGTLFAKQVIEYTDFPLDEIKLYCCLAEDAWIIMLTSEY